MLSARNATPNSERCRTWRLRDYAQRCLHNKPRGLRSQNGIFWIAVAHYLLEERPSITSMRACCTYSSYSSYTSLQQHCSGISPKRYPRSLLYDRLFGVADALVVIFSLDIYFPVKPQRLLIAVYRPKLSPHIPFERSTLPRAVRPVFEQRF